MSETARFLGFAFASADLLFEVDRDGIVVFAAGATRDYLGERDAELAGNPVSRLFLPADGSKFATYVLALQNGERGGPYKLRLVCGGDAMVSMFRLAENGANVSCTLSRTARKPVRSVSNAEQASPA